MESSIIIGVLIAIFILYKLKGMHRSPAELDAIAAALADGAILVDVRSPTEFAQGHLAGARNIPHGAIVSAQAELASASSSVVLYCASGTRSAMAARQLRSAGKLQVLDLGPMSNGAKLGSR